ncbi:MAG: hypothetical protein AMS17_10315 [Spirochaetes bacterium DG_61]|nr:MAG: hypothetical protein AMS17_10315 [Spirochaetes bacterium DG_61]
MKKARIEITGFTARFYDAIVLVGTAGLYQGMLKTVIAEMEIKPEDRILDLGAGTGKNACLMRANLSHKGNITAIEIGKEMMTQFKRKCGKYDNVVLSEQRIEEELPFENEFDKVLLSFVIHGFHQKLREGILKNAFKALKTDGKIFIFDWNEIHLKEQGPLFRLFMRTVECPEARDFIRQDLKKMLACTGFLDMKESFFARGKIRLLTARKAKGTLP